jgi:hypothetical protein
VDLADKVILVVRDREKDRARAVPPGVRLGDKAQDAVNAALQRPDCKVQVEKQRQCSWLGDIPLDFHARSRQFIPFGQKQALDLWR